MLRISFGTSPSFAFEFHGMIRYDTMKTVDKLPVIEHVENDQTNRVDVLKEPLFTISFSMFAKPFLSSGGE